MLQIKGKYTTAKVMIDNVEGQCIDQIYHMVNNMVFVNPVAIMPDTHQGKGSVIGFTMPLGEKVIPQELNEKGERIGGRVFMDRIYSNQDHHMNTLKEYAKKHGWLYKQQQTFSNPAYIDSIDDSKHTLTIACRLRPLEFRSYPYMDTMIYYTPSTGRLASSPGKYTGRKRLKIQSTGGASEQIPDR